MSAPSLINALSVLFVLVLTLLARGDNSEHDSHGHDTAHQCNSKYDKQCQVTELSDEEMFNRGKYIFI